MMYFFVVFEEVYVCDLGRGGEGGGGGRGGFGGMKGGQRMQQE